jgi:hypothetical protein
MILACPNESSQLILHCKLTAARPTHARKSFSGSLMVKECTPGNGFTSADAIYLRGLGILVEIGEFQAPISRRLIRLSDSSRPRNDDAPKNKSTYYQLISDRGNDF